MSAETLIEQAALAGVVLRIDNGELKASGNRAALLAMAGDLRTHKLALLQHLQSPAATDPPIDDADRWCWPASSAMNGAEIDLLTKRVDLFFYRNLPLPDAESLADQLVKRDREKDDRRVCMECKHLADMGHGWRCNNWQKAGVALKQRDAQLPADLVSQLQRCSGFTERTL